MLKPFSWPALAAALCAPGAVCAPSTAPDGEVELALSVEVEGTLSAGLKVPPGTEWAVLFHRKQGETEFETLTLALGPEGTYEAKLEGIGPAGLLIECYAAMRGAGGVRTLPAGAPGAFFKYTIPEAPTAPPAPVAGAPPSTGTALVAQPPVHGPIYVDASATELVHRKVTHPQEPTLLASGQVRYVLQKDEEDRHLFLGTRLVYTNQPVPNQARWSVGEIQATYAVGNHRVQAGDLQVQESEFTLGAGGRRGFDYTYSDRPLGAHAFALNTERQTGVTGLLWPVAGNAAYGGSLSYLWFGNALRTKLVFLTGRDDLATAANVVTAFAPPVREGSTGSLVVDGRFLENRLAVAGEYARSLFTKDAKDGAPKDSDQAWRLGGQWSEGAFSGQVGYREVGREFGTVGVAFFVGDRRVLDGSLGWTFPRWGLSATATDERINPTAQANLNQAWNQSLGLDTRIVLNPMASWRIGLRAGRQEAGIAANPLIPFSNSERAGLTTGLDLLLPPQLVLTFNAQFDHLRATGFSATTGTSVTLSMGGNLNLATWGRLSPNLSWSRIQGQPGDQQTTVTNAFLNAQFNLVPGRLGLLLNGGGSQTVLPTGLTLNAATAEGTLGLTLDAYLRNLARGNLGLKVRYTRNPAVAGIVEDNRVFLLLNLSF